MRKYVVCISTDTVYFGICNETNINRAKALKDCEAYYVYADNKTALLKAIEQQGINIDGLPVKQFARRLRVEKINL